jgi:hypothetical protein
MRFQTQVLVLVWAGILRLGLGPGVVEALPGELADRERRTGLAVRQVSSVSTSEHHSPLLSRSLACFAHHPSPVLLLIHSLHVAP